MKYLFIILNQRSSIDKLMIVGLDGETLTLVNPRNTHDRSDHETAIEELRLLPKSYHKVIQELIDGKAGWHQALVKETPLVMVQWVYTTSNTWELNGRGITDSQYEPYYRLIPREMMRRDHLTYLITE